MATRRTQSKTTAPTPDEPKKSGKKKSYRTNADKVREAYAGMQRDTRWWKPKDGKNYIRVLPSWNDSGLFAISAGLHYGFVLDGRDRAITCLQFNNRFSLHKPTKCPVCILIDRMQGSGDTEYKGSISRLRLSPKYWFNIIEKTKEGTPVEDAKVHMYGSNRKFFDVIGEAFDEDKYGDITDPEEGHDIIIQKSGSGMGTRYKYFVRPNTTGVGIPDWDKQLYQLDKEVLEWMSWDEMCSVINSNYPEAVQDLGLVKLFSSHGGGAVEEKEKSVARGPKASEKPKKEKKKAIDKVLEDEGETEEVEEEDDELAEEEAEDGEETEDAGEEEELAEESEEQDDEEDEDLDADLEDEVEEEDEDEEGLEEDD